MIWSNCEGRELLWLRLKVQIGISVNQKLAHQKQPPEVLYKKAVLKNFPIFTGKHLWWSFFNKVAGP